MAETTDGSGIFHTLLVLAFIVIAGISWILRSISEAEEKPWWRIAFVVAAIVAIVIYAVFLVRSMPPVASK